MIRASLMALALALAACGPTGETTKQDDAATTTAAAPQTRAGATAQDTCGAAQYSALVGTNIAAATFPADAGIRVIRPGDMVTEDFRPDRLNINVDANGVITSLECF